MAKEAWQSFLNQDFLSVPSVWITIAALINEELLIWCDSPFLHNLIKIIKHI